MFLSKLHSENLTRRFGASCRRGLRIPTCLDVEGGEPQADAELTGLGDRLLRGLGPNSIP
eukprot:7539351-Pyramimonas_sp.AAC.1